jgi:hypothetical protein
LLRCAVLQGKQFNVIVTEGRPDETGLTMARVLEELRLPTTVVLDSGVGYIMERLVSHAWILLFYAATAEPSGAAGAVPLLLRLCSCACARLGTSFGTRWLMSDARLVLLPMAPAGLTWCWWAQRRWWKAAASLTSWARTRWGVLTWQC